MAKNIAELIIDHYSTYNESKRLTDAFGLFELARTKELIERYLPASPITILDVGGASGVYSFWLAELGHRVHLIDIVPKHIEEARNRAETSSFRLEEISVGDARDLKVPGESVDLVLMHGPLYHLCAREDRHQALCEACRALRPGGVLLAFAITRYAGAVFGLTRGFVFDSEYMEMTRREIASGIRQNPPVWLKTFPEAYFHHPEELRAEIAAAGLDHETTVGVLGPAWLVPELKTDWENPAKRTILMEVARLLEDEPVMGPRMMVVGRKPAV